MLLCISIQNAIAPENEYVNMAFIPLDSENLSEANKDSFSHDFGDNMFPYFHGDSNTQLSEKNQMKMKSKKFHMYMLVLNLIFPVWC